MNSNDRLPLDAPPMSPARFFVRLVAAIICIDLFVGTLAGLSLLESHRQYQRRAEITTQNLSMVVDEELSSDFEKIDLAMQAVVDEADRQIAEKGNIDAPAIGNFLGRLQKRIPEIYSLRMADAQGNVRYGTGVLADAKINVADRAYFIRQRDNPKAGFTVVDSLFTRIDKKWAIPVSRRLNWSDGKFAGVVYANVSIDHINETFANIRVGRNGSVALRTDGGTLVASYPMLASRLGGIGTKVFFPEVQKMIQSGQNEGTVISRSPVDSIERTVSFRKISGYPFFVLIGFAVDDYMADWRSGAAKTSAAVGFFFLITILAGWWINRSWKRNFEQRHLLKQQAQQIQTDYVALEQTGLKARKLAKAVEQSPVSVVITDINGTIEYINPNFTESTGYTAAEAIGQNPRILKSGLTPLEVYQNLWKTLLDGRKWHGELLNRKKNGELFWEDTHISPLRGEDGVISHFIVVKEDITELKHAQEQLLKSHAELELKVAERTADLQRQYELYRSLIKAQSEIGEGVFIVENDRIVFANEALCQMYGYTEEQFKALPSFVDLAHPDDRARVAESIVKNHWLGLHGEDPENRHEIGFITRNGQRREAEIAVAILPSEDTLRIIVVLQDITERKQMGDELRRNESQLRLLLDSVAEAIYGIDLSGNCTFCNPSCLQMLGYMHADELIGKNMHQLIHHKHSNGTPAPR